MRGEEGGGDGGIKKRSGRGVLVTRLLGIYPGYLCPRCYGKGGKCGQSLKVKAVKVQ